MAIDTRWENVDELLKRSERTKDEKHAKAIAEIAAQRFAFPSKELPAYRTHVNVPEITMGVMVGDEEVAPDIVVVEKFNTGETVLKMTACVASVEQVNDAEGARAWKKAASIPQQAFYLYVPVGYGRKAKDICRRLKIRPEGVRTWRYTPRGFEINDVTEPPSPLAALMPPVVRRLLATP
jgi:hypothetical protein